MERPPGFQGLMIPGPKGGPAMILAGGAFDGKRMRKAIQRKTVDYFSSMILYNKRKKTNQPPKPLQPDPNYVIDMEPTNAYLNNHSTAISTNFVHSSINKQKCPINCIKWTPDGRRLITAAYSGEFTPMIWAHNDNCMISADDLGIIKYWQSSMNNLKAFQGHNDIIRDLSFSPSDNKFASCSDDGTIKIWNFMDATVERVLSGHGWDVKCLDWHPTKALLASGSKDNLVKLWDPKNGKLLTNFHGHKNTILSLSWNKNGHHLLTASRDQIVRVFDIRTMKEIQLCKGHKKDVTSIAWHPTHESMFVSGGYDGSINFWEMGTDSPIGSIPEAHDSAVWALDWHPLGHILTSGSNDYTTRFWTRNRPGDKMRERFDMTKEEAEAMGLGIDVDNNESYEQPFQPQPGGFSGLPGIGLRSKDSENDPYPSQSQEYQNQNQPYPSQNQAYANQNQQYQSYDQNQGYQGRGRGRGRGGRGNYQQNRDNYQQQRDSYNQKSGNKWND